MIARICKKKALQELHQNVKPDYFFDGETIGDFSFYYYYSYSLIFLCVSITLIITFTQTALMFLHLPQVMTDWQIVKYVINWSLSLLDQGGTQQNPKENTGSFFCPTVFSCQQTRLRSWLGGKVSSKVTARLTSELGGERGEGRQNTLTWKTEHL